MCGKISVWAGRSRADQVLSGVSMFPTLLRYGPCSPQLLGQYACMWHGSQLKCDGQCTHMGTPANSRRHAASCILHWDGVNWGADSINHPHTPFAPGAMVSPENCTPQIGSNPIPSTKHNCMLQLRNTLFAHNVQHCTCSSDRWHVANLSKACVGLHACPASQKCNLACINARELPQRLPQQCDRLLWPS